MLKSPCLDLIGSDCSAHRRPTNDDPRAPAGCRVLKPEAAMACARAEERCEQCRSFLPLASHKPPFWQIGKLLGLERSKPSVETPVQFPHG
jgi:hypothetical protein